MDSTSADLPAADAGGEMTGKVAGLDVSLPKYPEAEGASKGEESADVGAKMDQIAANAPDMPSADVKKPSKGIFGGLSFNKSSKTNVEVRANIIYLIDQIQSSLCKPSRNSAASSS